MSHRALLHVKLLVVSWPLALHLIVKIMFSRLVFQFEIDWFIVLKLYTCNSLGQHNCIRIGLEKSVRNQMWACLSKLLDLSVNFLKGMLRGLIVITPNHPELFGDIVYYRL